VENIPQVPGNPPKVGQNHASRKAVLATFSVLKSSGAKSLPIRLESLGLGNTAEVPRDPAKVGQNHVARKAVSATFLVLKLRGAVFRPD